MGEKRERTARIATLPEVLKILEKREKEGDFGYEQSLALEYTKKFSKIESGAIDKAREALVGLGISEKVSANIINVMPVDIMQLKQILASEKKALEPEVADKAFSVVESSRAKG